MCGIFVAFNPTGIEHLNPEALKQSTYAVQHRGPDNTGFYSDSLCFLGHTRLSIVGLETSANQPFRSQKYVMTYNGEVFNYLELRCELEKLGYSFTTNSDTEVVLKSFDCWGSKCFEKFNGMWALAIYDTQSHKVVVSRDRFGQKPLFILKNNEGLFVASEFQQLVGLSDKVIDFELIQMFLKEGTYEGDGRTFLTSIEEFPKAHYLEIGPDNKCVSHRYWNYWSGEIRKTDNDCLKKFSDLLEDAVRIRLRTDVPFGVLLSGGVDSTIIASYAKKLANSQDSIPAFTYSSNDAHDETKFASEVACKLNMPLTVREQDQTDKDYKNRLKELVRHLGRGHSSPAIVSVDYLYESIANNDIKVALDGQGADELLAGYKNYFALVIPWFFARGKFIQAYLCLLDQFKFGFISAIVLYLRNTVPPNLRKLMRLFYGYEKFFRRVKSEEKMRIIDNHPSNGRNKNPLNRYLIWHHNLGLENLLYYGDIVAMKNSVENRSPFMDHRIVDFVFSCDEKLKLYNAINKYALRVLPNYQEFKDILDREKIGFSSGIKRETKLSMIDDLRTSPILSWPIFNKSLSKFLISNDAMKAKYERFLFRLYQVHLWNQLFIEKKNDVSVEAESLTLSQN